MVIKKNNIIEKRNILNEIRCNNMHLQELRFFTIYLSKINARNPEETRLVRFPLSDFLAIMEIKKVNISELKQTTNNLLCKVVNVPLEKGGYTAFQLFKECTVTKDENNEDWYIEIDAHDKALPLMFDFKRDYFTYELWNALRLTSSNQLRMYEILKQYQKKGERTIEVEELKNLLFIGKNEYSDFNNFKRKVLMACQKALKENTDIYFEYELIKKTRGKVTAIKFNIFKNTEYTDQLSISEFVEQMSEHNNVLEHDESSTLYNDNESDNNELILRLNAKLKFLAEACQNEFSKEEMQLLWDLLIKILPPRILDNDTEVYDFLKRKYDELVWRSNITQIKHRFGYLKRILEAEIE